MGPSREILRPTPLARWPMASPLPTLMPLAIPTMSALSLESATLAMDSEATMESARLMPTPSDKWLTAFPWPMLMPPDTLTMLVLSPESATLVTATAIGQVAYGGARGVVTGVDYGYGRVAGYGAIGNRG